MFAYNPLDSDIRLVRFNPLPSTDSDAQSLQLELRHASFDENLHYAALSYVWGDPNSHSSDQININGNLFNSGHNLHIALMQLYQNGVRSWFWVDAICINQRDLEEKSSQVSQMRTIFSRAECVYVWLGSGSNETDTAMDFVSRVGPRALNVGVLDLWSNAQLRMEISQNLKKRANSAEVQVRGDATSITADRLIDFLFDLLREPDLQPGTISGKVGLTGTGTDPKEDHLVSGIMELMQREYWHRIWVVQEISLAQRAVVLCGDRATPLDIFDAVFSAISHCIRSGFRTLILETRGFGGRLTANFYDCIPLTTRRQLSQSEVVRLSNIVVQQGIPPGRPYYSATDARDIVFGLLGVITDGDTLGLRIDYKMTRADVFTTLTRAIMNEEDGRSRGYHLDKCIPRQEEDLSVDVLPSWVPDWQIIGKCGTDVFPINHHGVFDATAEKQPPYLPRVSSEDNAPGILRYPGCRVDIITEVMQPPQWTRISDWIASRIVDTERWLTSVRDFAKLGPDFGPEEDYVWRTITSHNTFEKQPLNDEKASIIRMIMHQEPIVIGELSAAQKEFLFNGLVNPAWLQSHFETLDKQLEYIVKQWPRSIGSINRGRTLFKTVNAMFGLGHVAIRPRDVVCLLWGQQSPIILRPRNDGEGDGFTFVGDAYVDGIMYGEFLKTGPGQETFDIY